MTMLQRSALKTAALSLLLGFVYVLALPLVNRLGGEYGRLQLTDCQIVFRQSNGGLVSLLAGRGDGLELRTVSSYAPAVPSRPMAERLAAFGFPADPAVAMTRPARQVRALVDAPQPEDGAPLALRDMSKDADLLAQKYGRPDGYAIARAWLGVRLDDGGLVPKLVLATPYLALKKSHREKLARIPTREKEAPCVPGFSVDVVYGALGDPWISSFTAIENGRF